MDPEVKIEQEALTADFPLFPGFFSHDQDAEGQEEFATVADSLSLKGQVWPGMGKMDLANDEMRRTRNQRKPKSVIDKMKRASEGIVPNQVIMTPDFKVERVKDVYDDSSSPIPGQEESVRPCLPDFCIRTDLLRLRHAKFQSQGVRRLRLLLRFRPTSPNSGETLPAV
jgi:hypothetical protein